MPAYKFYRKEEEKYSEFTKTIYPTSTEALKVCKRILRHCKLSNILITFNTHNRGIAHYFNRRIELPRRNIPLNLIIHEIGHLVCYAKYGPEEGTGHTKLLMRTLKPIYSFSRRYICSIMEFEHFEACDIY